MTEGVPFEPKGSLRDLLSDEEFREILAPFPGDGSAAGGDPGGDGGNHAVVLVLTDDPEDAEQISAYLLPRGARAQPVTDRYVALDQLRSHEFSAFVISVKVLGAVPSNYLERIHALESPPHQLGFITEHDAPVPAWAEEEGTVARRPLDDRTLSDLFPWLPEVTIEEATARTPAMRGTGEERGPSARRRETAEAAEAPERRASTHSDSPGTDHSREPAPRPGERPPDWLAAVRALLAARHEGRTTEEALRAWAEKDPACAGWGEVTDREGELTVRTGGTDRNALLAALAAELTDHPEPPAHPTARGDFGCLPTRDAWLAFWWRSVRGGREWERFAALVPLVEDLQPPRAGTEPSGAAPRDRLLRQLDGRMHAVRRHGGSLALLLLQAANPVAALDVIESLSPRLRGEDAIELDGDRVWCLLERADASVPASIASRIEELASEPSPQSLRAVGTLWRAGGASAEELVEFLAGEVRSASAAGEIDWVG